MGIRKFFDLTASPKELLTEASKFCRIDQRHERGSTGIFISKRTNCPDILLRLELGFLSHPNFFSFWQGKDKYDVKLFQKLFKLRVFNRARSSRELKFLSI